MEANIEGAPPMGQPESPPESPPAPISEPVPSADDARGALQAAATSFAGSVDAAIAAGVPPMEAVLIVQSVLANVATQNAGASAPPTPVATSPYVEPVSAEAQAAAIGGEASAEATAPAPETPA